MCSRRTSDSVKWQLVGPSAFIGRFGFSYRMSAKICYYSCTIGTVVNKEAVGDKQKSKMVQSANYQQ